MKVTLRTEQRYKIPTLMIIYEVLFLAVDTIGFHAQLDTTIVSVGTIEFGNELADIGGG